jgi:hypothetical protein
MAIRYPGAANHQLHGKSTTPLAPRIINVHTMVWDLQSCENYFAQAGNPYSHFGTGPNGEVFQWQDLTYRAASDLNGNNFCISIENADKGAGYPSWSGSDVPRFTPAQAEAIAQLVAWLCIRFGIPAVAVPDSLPSRHGPGYHRHGINPWRLPDGILYSNSYGKVCPGDRRINQFLNEIMPRVQTLVGTEDDMTPEEHQTLYDIAQLAQSLHGGNYLSTPGGDLSWLDQKLDPILDRLAAIETALAGGTPLPPAGLTELQGTFTGAVTLTPSADG